MLRSRPRGGVCLLKQHRKSYWKNEERKEVLKILRGPFIENEYKSLRNKNQRFFFSFSISKLLGIGLEFANPFRHSLESCWKTMCWFTFFFSLSQTSKDGSCHLLLHFYVALLSFFCWKNLLRPRLEKLKNGNSCSFKQTIRVIKNVTWELKHHARTTNKSGFLIDDYCLNYADFMASLFFIQFPHWV